MSVVSKRQYFVHFVLNNFSSDNRVLKEILSFGEAFPEKRVLLFAYHTPDVLPIERLSSNVCVIRVKLKTKSWPKCLQFLKYFEWGGVIWSVLKTRSVKILHCHDLNTLPLGVFFKKKLKTKLVYDAHELESEAFGLKGIKKAVIGRLERYLMPSVDHMVTVSKSIQEWYQDRFSVPVHLVRNIPQFSPEHFNGTVFRDRFNIPSNEPIFIYQGHLSYQRNIEALLELFCDRTDGKHLVCMGYGPLEGLISDYAKKSRTIHFHPSVSMKDLWLYTSSADVGFTLSEDICLSYRYGLPNKIFEYLLSRTLVICSDFPDVGDLVDEYNCGWRVWPSKQDVGHLLDSLNNDDILNKKQAFKLKDVHISWDLDMASIISAYRALLLKG